MQPNAFQMPGARPTLFLALFMTVLGMSGVAIGAASLFPGPRQGIESDELPEDVLASMQALSDDASATQLPRGLAAANFVASILLVGASFSLTARAKNALWWSGQALAANAIYSIAEAGVKLHLLQRFAPHLVEVAERAASVDAARMGEAVPPGVGDAVVGTFAFATIAFALFMLTIYGVLEALRRRSSVRAFVTGES